MAQNREHPGGPDRRKQSERRLSLMDRRMDELERMCRENSRGIFHVTECLTGYREFIDMLKDKERQRAELRQKLIDSLIGKGMWGLLVLVAGILWLGVRHWLKYGTDG